MQNQIVRFILRFLVPAFCSVVLLAGCSSLPSAGPTTDEIIQRSKDVNGGVELVSITPSVNAVLSRRRADSFIKTFGDYRPSLDPQIGIGDSLSITIWEAAAGGLFSSALVTDRFTILKSAFMRTMSDPEFLEDAKMMKLTIAPKDGQTVSELVKKMYASPPDLVQKVMRALKPN